MTHRSVHAAQILWPSFMAAVMLEILVFSVVDPAHISIGVWQPEVTTVYSLGFLAFWAITAVAAAMSHWMRLTPSASSALRRVKRQKRQTAAAHHAHG